MVFAVSKPSLHGHRLPKCDILIFEKVSTRETRIHEGLLQIFMDGSAYQEPQWVTFGRLIGSADTWDGMRDVMRTINVRKKRIATVPASSLGGL